MKQAKELAKLAPAEILSIVGRQIIDSRGNPTVEAGKDLCRNITSMRPQLNWVKLTHKRFRRCRDPQGLVQGRRPKRSIHWYP